MSLQEQNTTLQTQNAKLQVMLLYFAFKNFKNQRVFFLKEDLKYLVILSFKITFGFPESHGKEGDVKIICTQQSSNSLFADE